MFANKMRSKGYIEINLHLDYISTYDNKPVIDEIQSLWVLPLERDHFLIKESSGLLFDYKVFFGDEILVEQIDEKNYRLKSVVNPSSMCHFFSFSSGTPVSLNKGLRELGGDWESDMGGLTILHIPRNQLDQFELHFGMDLCNAHELVSGTQPKE